MNYILFDQERINLLPLTYTRPVSGLRIGILTLHEKWSRLLDNIPCDFSAEYLEPKFHCQISEQNILINASVHPDEELLKELHALKSHQVLTRLGKIVAFKADKEESKKIAGIIKSGKTVLMSDLNRKEIFINRQLIYIEKAKDLFLNNAQAIDFDFKLLSKKYNHAFNLEKHVTLIGDNIFIEEGAVLNACTINSKSGPVYIAADAEIMEGAHVRGPFALCEGSILKMGAKIYGPTTIGPYCKVGGEVSNSIFQGYSNKAHDGFVGNSIIGEWCNLGADSNTSNLKNNYGSIKVWCYRNENFEESGIQFHGLIMGDHSKCSINTMFNTGTSVGVSSNIFDGSFPPKFIPSFSWGGSEKLEEFDFDKAMEVAEVVHNRRMVPFSETEKIILRSVFELSAKFRKY